MRRSEAIKNLLTSRTHKDLASAYNANMEVQVNVAQDGGERTEGDYQGRMWHGWSDGISTWKSFRIPHNAKTDPEDNDYELKFDLSTHAEGIGMTGWDWKSKVSRWVGYDFDEIVGHSDKHKKKLPESELQKIQEAVSEIPWITVRKSTGGKGLHLYVHFDPVIATANHTEHAAVARAILGMLASFTAFDLRSSVDSVGGNMWVWHRKMQGEGLHLLKQGIPLSEIPLNWRDHLSVVSSKNRKTVPAFILEQGQANDVEQLFEELTAQKSRVALDAEHQKLIQYLHDLHANAWWDADNHMLVTHTKYLAMAHEKLGLRGIFKTNSPSTEDEQNCFCFVMRRGAWAVRRYTPGVAEDPTWEQDGAGWTKCTFNQEPTLSTASRSQGGIEHKGGGYVFREAEVAMRSAELLGVNIKLPNWIMGRRAKIKEHRDGRLLFEIAHDPNDRADDMEGWLSERGQWTKIFNRASTGATEPEAGNYDDLIRHLITESSEDYGWMIKRVGTWGLEPLVHVRTFLQSLNLKTPEVAAVLGSCIARPWRLVCRPFQPEILGDRDWNRNAPQLAHTPTQSDNLSYPTWLRILNHVGRGLDEAMSKNPWARANAVHTGADYLKCWVASLFKEPLQPLPYLFFYGPQNSGKSIFHEALELLMTCGVVRADNALINPQGFNAELENAVLAVVEETDLRRERGAYNRIKDWVTSRFLPIHRKNKTPYSVPNTAHWCHAANDHQACPVLPGDSRITMVYVDSLKPEDLIPKKILIPMLEKEASDFLAAILRLELPESGDRLNVPVIETGEKRSAQEANRSYLEVFIADHCHHVTGKMIKYSELYGRFIEWLDPDQVTRWSKVRMGKELPSQYPKGRSRQYSNQMFVGNISWEAKDPDEPNLKKLTLVGEYLE